MDSMVVELMEDSKRKDSEDVDLMKHSMGKEACVARDKDLRTDSVGFEQ